MKVFVSSSWRNASQPAVVQALRAAGHDVYDFRDPAGDSSQAGFSWTEVDVKADDWTAAKLRDALTHPRVEEAFSFDRNALRDCDALVMLQPCGRSAALELGWAAGAGKPTIVLLADGEPELMLKLADYFCLTIEEVIHHLNNLSS